MVIGGGASSDRERLIPFSSIQKEQLIPGNQKKKGDDFMGRWSVLVGELVGREKIKGYDFMGRRSVLVGSSAGSIAIDSRSQPIIF